LSTPIISGTGKATNFNFCTHILSIDRNKSPLQISGKVSGCVVRTLKTFQGTHILGALHGLLCDSSAVLFIEQMTSLLTLCYIQHVWWHYKSVCSLLINFHEWVKYSTTTNCAKDQCPPDSADLSQPTQLPCVVSIWCELNQNCR